MASRAGNGGGGISRIAISDRFSVLFVAGKAGQVNCMIAWVITRGRMGKTGWRPALRGMTGVALHRRVKMPLCACWWLTGRVSTVVTSRTTNANPLMVKCAAHESCGSVTVRAITPCSVLVNWVTRRPDCRISVVTRSAIVDDVGMIESHRDETLRIMTGTTIQSGRRVWGGGRLSCG